MRSSRRAGHSAAQPGRPDPQQAGAQRAQRPRVQQASVTSTSLTNAERARLRALSTAARAQPPAQATRARSAGSTGSTGPAGRGWPAAGSRPAGAGRPAEATRAARTTRPQSAPPRPPGPPALRRSTGLTLAAAGAILWLGVHGHILFVETQTAGFILFVTGLAWLVIPVRRKRTLVRRQFDRVMRYLSWKPATPGEANTSLEELLQRPSAVRPGGDSPG